MTDESRPVAAAAWMMGAVVSFTTMAVAGRELSTSLDTFEILLYRSLIGLCLVLAVFRLRPSAGPIRARRLGLHVARNICHFAGQNLWLFAVATIPLSQVFALEFSQPVWVALAAPFFLAERLTRMRVTAALVGFLGILIVARPGAVPLSDGTIAAFFAAIFFAGTTIATKRLTRSESTISILFWLTAIQAVLGLATAGYDMDIALPGAASLPLVTLYAVCGLMAHFCITTALNLAPAVVVMPLDFLRLPVVAVIGMLLYAEALDPLVFLGAAVIFGANYLNILTETRRARSRT